MDYQQNPPPLERAQIPRPRKVKRARSSFPTSLIACALSLLTSCGSVPTQEVATKVVSLPPVLVPVAVPCLRPDEVPPIPPTAMRPKSEPLQLTNQADVDFAELNAYAIKADGMLRGCSKLPQPQGDTK